MHGLELLTDTAAGLMRFLAGAHVDAIATWVLAGALVWSGVTKVRRPERASAGVVRFGLLEQASREVGRRIGLAELSLALLLMAAVVPLIALAIAAAVFTVFAWLIAAQLRSGDARPCYCFGSDEPLNRIALLRAVALAGVALILAATAPLVGAPPLLDEIARNATGAAAILAVLALGSALPTVLSLTREEAR